MAEPRQAPITLIQQSHATTGGAPIDAQCPACSLHELVPIHLKQEADGQWRQLPPSRPGSEASLTIDACPVCFGVWFDQDEIDALGDVDIDPAFLKTMVGRSANRMCPRGHGFMNEHVIPDLLKSPIDRCPVCRGLWLDGDERYALAKSSTRTGQTDRKVELAKRGLIWAAQILTQLPVEVENPARGTPWVIYALVALLIGTYIASVYGVVYARDFALVAGALRGDPTLIYTLFSHIFFHADWFHLLGNLYFLYVFGDNVEHIYGRRRFLVLFFGAGLVGGIFELFLTKSTATPVIGASGAIAAVMAAYLWIYPKAKLLQVVPIVYIQLTIPAWVYVGIWVIFQAVMGFFSDAMGMAWFSHLFGFACGLAMTPWVLGRRRDEVAAKVRFRSARSIFGERLAKRAPAQQPSAQHMPTNQAIPGVPPTDPRRPQPDSPAGAPRGGAAGATVAAAAAAAARVTASQRPSSFTQAGAPRTRGQGFARSPGTRAAPKRDESDSSSER